MHTRLQTIPRNPDTCAEDIAQLKAALIAAKSDDEYQAIKTKLEQAAGRQALASIGITDAVYKGKEELQRRFGKHAILSACWEKREGKYWVDVLVAPADGHPPMTYTELLEDFPSDECIANLALVT